LTIIEGLNDDLRDAIRSKDSLRRTVLRTLLSEIANAKIAKRSDLTEEEILVVITKQSQQRKDSIEAFADAGRKDLEDKERLELELISTYLPEQLSEEEVQDIIDGVLLEVGATGPSDMGKVMGIVMPKVRGRTDGKIVNSIVVSKLKEL
jgi:uncharacterized protein YqeY|tara:strand:- start:56 stop:505 length:450 start_codon:yes stop_codon:yes gene_type:complete